MFPPRLTCITWLLIIAGSVQVSSTDQSPNAKDVADKLDILFQRIDDGLSIKELDEAVLDLMVFIDKTYLNNSIDWGKNPGQDPDMGNWTYFNDRLVRQLDALGQLWKQLNNSLNDKETLPESIDRLIDIIESVLLNVASLLKSIPDFRDTILSHRTPRQSGESCQKPCYYDDYECLCPPPPPTYKPPPPPTYKPPPPPTYKPPPPPTYKPPPPPTYKPPPPPTYNPPPPPTYKPPPPHTYKPPPPPTYKPPPPPTYKPPPIPTYRPPPPPTYKPPPIPTYKPPPPPTYRPPPPPTYKPPPPPPYVPPPPPPTPY